MTPSSTPCSPHMAAYTKKGLPVYQQDRTLATDVHKNIKLLAVADGHGSAETGHLASEYAIANLTKQLHRHNSITNPCEQALTNAIQQLDLELISYTSSLKQYAGTTLCMVLQDEHAGKLHIANVGDSRALLISHDASVVQLTNDHNVHDDNERQRVEQAGGIIMGNLINGYISVTRGLGDDDLKAHRNITNFPCVQQRQTFSDQLYINVPDVSTVKIESYHCALVIMSDGVTAKLSDKHIAKIVMTCVKNGNDVQQIAKKIVTTAIHKGSKDNVSAVASFLPQKQATTDVHNSEISSSASSYSSSSYGSSDEEQQVGMRHKLSNLRFPKFHRQRR